MPYTLTLNYAMYYLTLQYLNAKSRNAGRSFVIDKTDIYSAGEAEYISLSPEEQHSVSVMAAKVADQLFSKLQDCPGTLILRMRPAVLIDAQDNSGSQESYLFEPEL